MQVPLEWLKQYVDPGATAQAIAERLTMGGLEVEGIEESGLGPVLDVYVTPNRGDCLSLVGIARETSALFGVSLHKPSPPPSSDGGSVSSIASVSIEEPLLCPRYAARVVSGVRIGPSPEWMQARLEAVGQRPINNVVDVTNYVMLELGQPLHAFDLTRLRGKRIVVRCARQGESIQTLDGVQRELTDSMLVIADADRPVAVAGLIGGSDSEVHDGTTDLLLESAHFDPLSVRRTGRALGLRTEASYRFERIVDPDGVRRAVDRACELLAGIGQPAAVDGVIDVYPHPAAERVLELRVARAAALLGMDLSSHICADCLRAVGFHVETESHGAEDTLHVRVPSFRPDVTIEEDLIEEVGRIHGYENIPETLPSGATLLGGDSAEGRLIREVKQALVGCGLQEVVTHSLTAPSFFDSPADAARRVSVRNALSSNIGGLRRSLIASLLDVAQYNATHGQRSLSIFEVGRIWQNEDRDGDHEAVEYVAVAGLLTGSFGESGWQKDSKPPIADVSAARGVLDRMLESCGVGPATYRPLGDRAGEATLFHPGRAASLSLRGGRVEGMIGEVHPSISERLDLRHRICVFEIGLSAIQAAQPEVGTRYKPFSRNQAIHRDLAPRVSDTVAFAEIAAAIRAADSPILELFRLTDVYSGTPLPEGTQSFTLSFKFAFQPSDSDEDRPVTEAEVSTALEAIRASIVARCFATFAG